MIMLCAKVWRIHHSQEAYGVPWSEGPWLTVKFSGRSFSPQLVVEEAVTELDNGDNRTLKQYWKDHSVRSQEDIIIIVSGKVRRPLIC